MNRKQRRIAGKPVGNGAAGFGRPASAGQGIPAQDLFAQALRHAQAGRVAEAEGLLRRILAAEPGHADSLHFLGVMTARAGRHDAAIGLIGRAASVRAGDAAIQVSLGNALLDGGRLDDGVECYRRAVALRPDFVDAHINLGLALQQRGDLESAAACFRHLLSLQPNLADAHFNLGNIYYDQRRFDDAAECYRRAIVFQPGFAQAHYNLGKANRDRGEPEAAASAYRQAIALRPDFVDAHINLGRAAQQLGNLEEAASCFRRAIAIAPASADAHFNLGNLRKKQDRLDEAVACYRRAVEIKLDFAEAHFSLGDVRKAQDEIAEAAACYQRAVAIKPDFGEAHYNLGLALQEQGMFDDAVECYRRAIAVAPGLGRAHHNLGGLLGDRGELEAAVASTRKAVEIEPDSVGSLMQLTHLRQQICDWDGLEGEIVRTLDLAGHGGKISPFMVLAQSTSPELHLTCARRWAEEACGRTERRFAHTRPSAERRIRLGYLSVDFRVHPVAFQVIETIERHDRSRFEIIGYSLGPDDGSEVRRRLEKGFDRFVDLRALSDAEAAGRIHADGIDILVDLTGPTRGARTKILAARPAPIQVNWLGYAGTMGADFMDYILVDAFSVPPEQQPFFTEKLVHLPHCFMPSDTVRRIAETTPTRAECGLPEGAFVFCCFNTSFKITPHFFALWMELLAALPGSVLWLRGDETVQRNLLREGAARGVDPARLVFAPQVPMDEHLARYRQADLFLDTLPYNAHATASDALWAGLPVLTLAGACFPGRVAGSMLRAVGLPELVTTSEEEYRALALRLARDPALLGQYRQRLSQNRATAPLFDTAGFTRDIETVYERMCHHWRTGELPASF